MYPQLGLRFRGNNKGFREIVASGGVITGPAASGGYRYHTFINSETFTLDVRGVIEYLVVGGGGGGGNDSTGGGAGDVITGEIFLEAGTYLVSVGGGGRGAAGRPHFQTYTPSSSGNGGSSSFVGQVAAGGFGGNQGGSSGGPGGGSGGGVNGSGGSGTAVSDYAAATGTGSGGYYAGGGGGARYIYAGRPGGYISGGLGGGGRGGFTLGENDNFGPSGGQARTGSGGGAGYRNVENYIQGGASGASGIVIVRYRIYKV